MWTLKSILLAKLLNAGMNGWLLAPVQLVQLCSASLSAEHILSQTGAQSTTLNQQGNNLWMISLVVIFSHQNIRLVFMKYQASSHEYNPFLLFHVK